jgi:hypothetical protein|eukprot:2904305-Prymnesium_polylepis.1
MALSDSLKAGVAVRKIGRDGKQRATTLQLSQDGQTLSWTGRRLGLAKSASARAFSVSDIIAVNSRAALCVLLLTRTACSDHRRGYI